MGRNVKKWPTGVAISWLSPIKLDLAGDLTRFADQAAMAVDDTLGRADHTGGESDHGGAAGSAATVPASGSSASRSSKSLPIGPIGHPAELLGSDEHPRFGGGQDVRQLLAAVGTSIAPRNADAQNVAAASIQFGS